MMIIMMVIIITIIIIMMMIIEVPDETLVERGCGRRLDPETGDIYHMKFKRAAPPNNDKINVNANNIVNTT